MACSLVPRPGNANRYHGEGERSKRLRYPPYVGKVPLGPAPVFAAAVAAFGDTQGAQPSSQHDRGRGVMKNESLTCE